MATYKVTEQDTIRETFARNLRRLMYADDLSQKDLAEKINVAPSTVSAWCGGAKMPRTETIQELADIFGVDRAELLSDRPKTTNYEDNPASITGTLTIEDLAIAQEIAKLSPQEKRLVMSLVKFCIDEKKKTP